MKLYIRKMLRLYLVFVVLGSLLVSGTAFKLGEEHQHAHDHEHEHHEQHDEHEHQIVDAHSEEHSRDSQHDHQEDRDGKAEQFDDDLGAVDFSK